MIKKAFIILGTGSLLFAGIIKVNATSNMLYETKKEIKEKSNTNPFELSEKNYVVVGVFDDVIKAIQHTDRLYEQGIYTKFGWDPSSKKIYVYVTATENIEEARKVRNRLRRKKGLSKTWILSYTPTKDQAEQRDLPDLQQKETKTQGAENTGTPQLVSKEKAIAGTSSAIQKNIHSIDDVSQNTEVKVEGPIEKEINSADLLNLYFDSFNAQNLESILAKIEIVDPKASKLVKLTSAHDLYELDKKRFTGDTALLICDAFGYRKMQHIIDLNKLDKVTQKDFAIAQGDSTIINFELQRPMPGDIMVMYNVYFHNDAAVMKPTSRYELGKLLKMMQENKNYKIKIHGHTNGNGFGKIIKPAKASDELFRLSSDNKSNVGGAKALSKARAETIKRYLELEGIETSRMEVEGWGGKRMLYDSKSPEAKKNMRVEIEIIEN